MEKAKLKVNYFKGNDRSKWVCDVPTSLGILYKNLYNNIDLKVYGSEKQVEYDWIVRPGGNPEDIQFHLKNIKSTSIDKGGNLVIETPLGKVKHKKPVAFQMINNKKVKIKSQFKRIGNEKNIYGFFIGTYDKNHELIIDPVYLSYSTYLGGSDQDVGYGIAINDIFVYVCGYTLSTNFPTARQYQTDQTDWDAFITKLYDSADTMVMVSDFSVSCDGGQAVVQWETSSETGTIGFHLFRKGKDDKTYQRVNRSMLVGLLTSPQGVCTGWWTPGFHLTRSAPINWWRSSPGGEGASMAPLRSLWAPERP